ncbi:MAG: 23S rRNA (adenine(2503)-C(2))-methyltransferase RlmN [Candidatus Egerieousia sp.]|nr:23S rRNA (adenine(2503)-C(2))-methyltransferase RlmN [bacterium]MDY5255750.1 23S rRNA (adenine(2503)-C(2))-methyltransferase RlmN [Candidatus Egerieousia sp.]
MRTLLGKTLEELKEIALELSLPAFTAKQIADWLYKKRVTSIDKMTNLSKSARERLSKEFVIGIDQTLQVVTSQDGTRKYLFKPQSAAEQQSTAGPQSTAERQSTAGRQSAAEQQSTAEQPGCASGSIESVIIPDNERKTICVSSQVGCKMACTFCMTGRQGFHGNLSVASILSQFIAVEESQELTNAVFMGMGEPLDNLENVMRAIEVLTADWGFAWSPKRITLSTIGVTTQLGGRGIVWKGVEYKNVNPLKFFLDNCKVHLAVSLHNPFYEERLALMPAERTFPLEKSLKLIKEYDFTGQRRVSFEYTMFNKVNDSKRHADRLAQLLRGLECRVNLIRFHSIPDSPLESSPMQVIEHFRERLQASGITATIRASRGEDILAACGMLSGKGNNL